MSTFDVEFELGVPAARLWRALKDGNTLFPKIAPAIMASIEHVEGEDGVPGAVRLIKFGPVAPEGTYVKEKFVSIDQDNMTVVSSEVEGGHLASGFTKWQATLKLVPVGDDKVKVHNSFEYEGGGPESGFVIAQTKEGAPQVFKLLADYLLANGEYA